MTDPVEPIEHAWEPARLIPVTGIGGALEQEGRATSALLAVLHIVPSFSKAILRYFRAPAGHVTTFREVTLEDREGNSQRPDGAIVVTRGKTKWTCLVEVKTAGNDLDADQVDRYLALAKQYKFDALLTISNQLVSSPEYSPVKVTKKAMGNVTLRHISWLRILTEAVNEYEHHGVNDPEQAWILGQLVDYLSHPRTGSGGFEGMGGSWVPIRDAAKLGTLTSSDPGVKEVVQDWQQFTEFLCLGLRQTLGSNVLPVYPRNSSASDRLTDAIQLLGRHQRLESTVNVPDAVGPIKVVADLESRLVTTSVRVVAPKDGYAKTRINWLLRQLKDAPDDLRITVSFPRVRTKTSLLPCSSCRPVHARARYARWNISSVPSGHYTQGRDTHAGIASGNASSTVSYLQFLQSIEKAIAVRTLESLARIELGAQGGALLERVTTTRISKSGVATTTVRERFTAPDWHADGWFGLVLADGVRPARPRLGEGG